MRKIVFIAGIVIGCAVFLGARTPVEALFSGSGISQLDQWTSTSTPSSAITQQTYGKAIKLTGLTTGACLTLDGSGILTTTTCGSGGGSGTISTSSPLTAPQVLYATGPGTVASAATGTLSANSPLTVTAARYVIGGSATLSLDTSGTWSGNAGTASALAANGSNCSAGSFPLGVNASGTVENCTDAWTEAENTSAAYISDGNTNWDNLYGFITSATDVQFSTTSADYWKTQRNFFATTSADYWKTVNNFFSTTSADYWETQQTARTADDLTNNSIEDLNDVAAMAEAYGDVITWNGSTWTNFATSSLFNNASASRTGLLSSTDWSTFNNKQATISATFPIILTGAALAFGGLSTSSTPTIGQLPYWTGVNTFGSVGTTSIGCSGLIGCTGFVGLGAASTIALSAQAANTVVANGTGASAVPTAVATSTFFGSPTAGRILAFLGGSWVPAATTTFSSGLTYSQGNVTADLGTSITVGELASADFGDFTCNGVSCTNDTAYTPTARTITVAGTANQLTSSAGAQDLSANRTWTLSLPNNVIFPLAFNSTYGTTTYASSTALTATNLFSIHATTTNLAISSLLTFNGVTSSTWAGFCATITGSAALCDGDDASGGGGGGAGNSKWATSTNLLGIYPNDSTMDVWLGSTATATAPFWWDVSATTSYIGNGGAGDSTMQFGPSSNEWSIGYDDTDKSFAISSSTTLGTNSALTIAKSTGRTTLSALTVTGGTTLATSLTGILKAASGVVSAGANGTDYTLLSAVTCTNQVLTALTAAGASTCSSINNAFWSGADLAVTNGGTGLSTFGGTNFVLYTTAADTLSSEAAYTYNPSKDLLTAINASTTLMSSDGSAWFARTSGNVAIASTTPWSRFAIGTGNASSSITVAEYKYGATGNVATSTAESIDCRSSNQIAWPIGKTATTLTLRGLTPGQSCRVVVQNAGGGSAGAITWAVQSDAILTWVGGSVPTQTTTAKKMDVYSFITTMGSSTMQVIGTASLNVF